MAKNIIRQMQNIYIHIKGKTFHVTGPTLRGSYMCVKMSKIFPISNSIKYFKIKLLSFQIRIP